MNSVGSWGAVLRL